jgi:hypothetical protein
MPATAAAELADNNFQHRWSTAEWLVRQRGTTVSRRLLSAPAAAPLVELGVPADDHGGG